MTCIWRLYTKIIFLRGNTLRCGKFNSTWRISSATNTNKSKDDLIAVPPQSVCMPQLSIIIACSLESIKYIPAESDVLPRIYCHWLYRTFGHFRCSQWDKFVKVMIFPFLWRHNCAKMDICLICSTCCCGCVDEICGLACQGQVSRTR